MKKISFNNYLTIIIIMVIIVTVGYFLIKGIPLFGVPKIEDVSYVEISDNKLNINARKFTEMKDIEKAVNLTNLLLYKLGTPEEKEPIIELVFHLKDGNSFVISANEKTVYSNGKAYSLKGDNGKAFIKIIEGAFFFSELVEKEKGK